VEALAETLVTVVVQRIVVVEVKVDCEALTV